MSGLPAPEPVGAAGERAVQAALGRLADGQTVGVGGGPLAAHFLEALAAARAAGRHRGTQVVPAGWAAAWRARHLGLPLAAAPPRLDVMVDEALRVDPLGHLLQGAGGRAGEEKALWRRAGRRLLLATPATLGPLDGLPVSLQLHPQLDLPRLDEQLRALGGHALQLVVSDPPGDPCWDEQGRLLARCRFERLPVGLEGALEALDGVAACGLLQGYCPEILVG